MARKPVARDLPPLARMLPGFRGLDQQKVLTLELTDRLRPVAKRLRRQQSIPFYPAREVAAFFGVSYRTAIKAFAILEREGLLLCAQGSQTTLAGRKFGGRAAVRGVVGIPIYLPGFVIGTSWRALIRALEQRLRQYGFVADLIFFRQSERDANLMTGRLLEHKLDAVYWHIPIATDHMTIEQLIDAGIPVVAQTVELGVLPVNQYLLDIKPALRECMRRWAADGIREVQLLYSTESQPQETEVPYKTFLQVAKQLGLRFEAVDLHSSRVEVHFSNLLRANPAPGVVLLTHHWYEWLCMRFPETMASVFAQRRVLLPQEPVFNAYFEARNTRVDTFIYDVDETAQRIAADISSGRAFRHVHLETFSPRYAAGVELGSVTRDIF